MAVGNAVGARRRIRGPSPAATLSGRGEEELQEGEAAGGRARAGASIAAGPRIGSGEGRPGLRLQPAEDPMPPAERGVAVDAHALGGGANRFGVPHRPEERHPGQGALGPGQDRSGEIGECASAGEAPIALPPGEGPPPMDTPGPGCLRVRAVRTREASVWKPNESHELEQVADPRQVAGTDTAGDGHGSSPPHERLWDLLGRLLGRKKDAPGRGPCHGRAGTNNLPGQNARAFRVGPNAWGCDGSRGPLRSVVGVRAVPWVRLLVGVGGWGGWNGAEGLFQGWWRNTLQG